MANHQHQEEESYMDSSNSSPSLPNGALRGNGRFLDAVRVFQVMLHKQPTGNKVPNGLKENVYFLINNEQNMFRRGKGKLSRHVDDCGTWSFNASCKSHHYIIRGEMLDNVHLKDGQYCKEQKNCLVPLEPQPPDEQVITFKRYYVSLKRCPKYRKRISTIAKCPDSFVHLKNVAVVEYTGTYPRDVNLNEASVNDHSGSKMLMEMQPSSIHKFLENNGKFLDATGLFHVMLYKPTCGEDIPAGTKENVYFLLDNGQNVTRRAEGKHSRYVDDCGLWSANVKTRYRHYLILEEMSLDSLVLKDGQYHKIVKGEHVLLAPQPTKEDVIEFKQLDRNFKDNALYKKRVSIVINCPDSLSHLKNLAIVEYIGKYPNTSVDSMDCQQVWEQNDGDIEEYVVCSPDIQPLDAEVPPRTDGIPIENGRFLDVDSVFNIMLFRKPIGDGVPSGIKENVCFLIDNTQNMVRKANGKKSRYSDDYGNWTARPSSDIDHYILCNNFHLAYASLVDGLYCNVSKGKRVPVNPQPTEDDIVVFSRYRVSLKGDPECRKRITTVLRCPEGFANLKNLAVIEYIRTMPVSVNENSRTGDRNSDLGNNAVVSADSMGHVNLKPMVSEYAIHNHGRFLDGNSVFHILLHGNPIEKEVLSGIKENVNFLYAVEQNQPSESPGLKCPYVDDCGPWIAKPSCKTHHYILSGNEELDYVDLKDGQFCKDNKGVRIPLEPQPSAQEIITFKRYYGYLKSNPNYKRKVSTVLKCPDDLAHLKKLAVVEYVGCFFG